MALVPSSTSGTLGAAEAAVTVLCADSDSIAVQVVGTFTGTITFECSLDGTNWSAIAMKASSQTAAATLVTTASAAGVFTVPTVAVQYVRARMSAYTDGSANVTVALTRFSK